MALLRHEVSGSVATITMDDGKANAIGPPMQHALFEALDAAEAESVGVVLAGRPGRFSGGFTARRVALDASTSVPAVYELFGDKAGLVRELFYDGWRQLRAQFERLLETDDCRADLEAVIATFRRFVVDHPVLADVMLSGPFGDFDPGPAERAGGDAVREFIVALVRRCVDAGLLRGDPSDIGHVVLGLAQGLAAQESAGWLGSSRASRDRRWALAVRSTLDGLST